MPSSNNIYLKGYSAFRKNNNILKTCLFARQEKCLTNHFVITNLSIRGTRMVKKTNGTKIGKKKCIKLWKISC